MGQHADDAIFEAMLEEDRRARELPDGEPINAQFDYKLPTEENIDSELEKLSIFLGGYYG